MYSQKTITDCTIMFRMADLELSVRDCYCHCRCPRDMVLEPDNRKNCCHFRGDEVRNHGRDPRISSSRKIPGYRSPTTKAWVTRCACWLSSLPRHDDSAPSSDASPKPSHRPTQDNKERNYCCKLSPLSLLHVTAVGLAYILCFVTVTSATFLFPEGEGSPAYLKNKNSSTGAAGTPGVEARHLTLFPGFSPRSQCILPEGYLGVCLSAKNCAFTEYQLNLASETRDISLWRHLRGFVCGFERLQPKFCCPHPLDSFYDFEERPEEHYIQSVFAKAEGLGVGGNTGSGGARRVPPILGAVPSAPAGPPQTFEPKPGPQPSPPVAPPISQETCGQQGVVDFRIVGGNGTVAGMWPWAAAIGRKDSKSGRMAWGCGGALITAKHVLTAAHCLPLGSEGKRLVTSVFKQYVVRLGDVNILSENTEDEPQDFSVVTAVPHPQYERRPSFWNDIAVLRLNKVALISDFVSPVCTPLEPRTNEQLERESALIAIGWGSDGKKSTVDNLQVVSIPVVPISRCRTHYQSFNIPLRDTQMCAGIEGRDTCKGDSGAPVMLYHPTRKAFEIVGITSIGSTACGSGLPGVYTKVDAYIDWIRDTIRKTN